MIQYSRNFPDKSVVGLVAAFFKIWEGGIIFYGSALGGAFGYGLFYWYVLRRMKINGWKLADAAAPLLAFGLAVGRIGCYLNGCCWGQVACEECQTVPLGAAHFPLLPAHARPDLVSRQYLQTTTGFTSKSFDGDPRTRVDAVEVGSTADHAGLLPNDLIVKVNGEPNSIFIDFIGSQEKIDAAVAAVKGDKKVIELPDGRKRLEFADYKAYTEARKELHNADVRISTSDRLEETIRDWPRGKGKLTLSVERSPGGTIDLPAFMPETVGLYPTQLYETVSMAADRAVFTRVLSVPSARRPADDILDDGVCVSPVRE